MEQIGKNTGYIIHPDEIPGGQLLHVADQERKSRSAELLEKLAKSLKMQ